MSANWSLGNGFIKLSYRKFPTKSVRGAQGEDRNHDLRIASVPLADERDS